MAMAAVPWKGEGFPNAVEAFSVLARRDEGEYSAYSTEEQRSQGRGGPTTSGRIHLSRGLARWAALLVLVASSSVVSCEVLVRVDANQLPLPAAPDAAQDSVGGGDAAVGDGGADRGGGAKDLLEASADSTSDGDLDAAPDVAPADASSESAGVDEPDADIDVASPTDPSDDAGLLDPTD
jgi:hypothetical protein